MGLDDDIERISRYARLVFVVYLFVRQTFSVSFSTFFLVFFFSFFFPPLCSVHSERSDIVGGLSGGPNSKLWSRLNVIIVLLSIFVFLILIGLLLLLLHLSKSWSDEENGETPLPNATKMHREGSLFERRFW